MSNEIRTALEKSWNASCAYRGAVGAVTLNAASMAGMLLTLAGGDACRAIGMFPLLSAPSDPYWMRVTALLAEVDEETRSARGPRLTGTGGR
jgi:hypothetical protein